YLADGTLDNCFGANGVTVNDFGIGHDVAYAVAIQPDGRIVAAGSSWDGTLLFNPTVSRYLADGESNPTASPTNTPTPNVVISGTVTYGNANGAPGTRFVSNALISGDGLTPVSTL